MNPAWKAFLDRPILENRSQLTILSQILWKVAFVVIGVLPLVSLAAIAVLTINQTKGARESRAYSKAGSVAYSTVSAIKTVLSLNAIPEMIRQYKEATLEAFTIAVAPLWSQGFALGEQKARTFRVNHSFSRNRLNCAFFNHYCSCSYSRFHAWKFHHSLLHFGAFWNLLVMVRRTGYWLRSLRICRR